MYTPVTSTKKTSRRSCQQSNSVVIPMRSPLLIGRRNGKRKISNSLETSNSPSKGIAPQDTKLSSRRRKNIGDLTFNASSTRRPHRCLPLSFSPPLLSSSEPIYSKSKLSPMKTRRFQKTSRNKFPRCSLCKRSKGELYSCSVCHLQYHLRKCLMLSENATKIVEKKIDWVCPKCICCSGCLSFVDDPQNVECSNCLCAWHGLCRPKGIYVDHNWLCPKCAKEVTTINPVKSPKVEQKTVGQNVEVTKSSTVRRRGRPRGSRIHKDSTSSIHSTQTTLNASVELDDDSAAIISARNDLYNQLLEQLDSQKDPLHSPRRRDNTRSPVKRMRQNRPLALQEDTDMFLSAKKALEEEKGDCKKSCAPSGSNCQWVYMGTGNKMKAVYNSPYPDDVRNASSIYICTYCLKPTSDVDSYRIHQTYCPLHHPPGCEIYRDEKISFFEVNGADQKSYCRHLCLLAKLFISSKTLHHEVDTFLFYVLTENTNEGCRIVGYFSKEKNPSKNNNLSCLLTLPNSQRSGYGRLLIDMSYALSRIERKVGSPEHPLSDLGLFAYRGYWRSSILCYLRSVRSVPHTSIKEMSLRTRIHPIDIVNQLMRDRLLVYKDGNYFVKTGKRAYKWPLVVCRRRVVDESHIQWKPDFDVNALDPNKLNYYV